MHSWLAFSPLLLSFPFLTVTGSAAARAIFPLTGLTRGRDISINGNAAARLVNVKPAPGPDGLPLGSFHLQGIANSYIYFPNTGCLDTKNSLTIVLWVYPEGRGPIFHYFPKGWGVHLWLKNTRTLLVKFVPRSLQTISAVTSRKIRPRAWNYIAATYDHVTGLATLWNDAIPISQRNIGKIQLATNYPAISGKKLRDRKIFRGRIACLQIYDRALNGRQLRSIKKKCFRGLWGLLQLFVTVIKIILSLTICQHHWTATTKTSHSIIFIGGKNFKCTKRC